MNALGQLLLYCLVGFSYFLIFAMTAPLIARVLLGVYKTGYWYPVVFVLTLSLVTIVHKGLVKRHIAFGLQVNVGKMLLRNLGKALAFLFLTLVYVQLLFLTGINEGSLL